jgi:N,N-dimethylformamidase beta subunit-like, C-terminal/Concanavalin A-like lectin/glucanases superfamily
VRWQRQERTVSEVPTKIVVGYADRLSVAPDETIRFMVNVDGEARYRADIVKLTSGDWHPRGAGFKEKLIATTANGDYPGRRQEIHPGSFAIVADDPRFTVHSFSLQAMIWPTTPLKGRQTILGKWSVAQNCGFALGIDDGGALALTIDDGVRTAEVSSGRALLEREWYFVGAAFEAASRRATLFQEPLARLFQDGGVTLDRIVEVSGPARNDAPVTIAGLLSKNSHGREIGVALFNGKIDSPRIAARALSQTEMEHAIRRPPPEDVAPAIVAAWDFSLDIPSQQILDVSPNRLHGRLVNMPARAMKGYNWSGDEHDWKHAPSQYGAIHFHDDDLYDAGWEADFTLTIPNDMPSAVYAARLKAGADSDYVPFVVRPARQRPSANVLLLLPTASYMAYANEHAAFDSSETEVLSGHLVAYKPEDLFLNEHREYGYSLYDTHSDGSGVCHSSRLRPILNMRPGYTNPWIGIGGSAPWQFNADLHIVDWLEAIGQKFDVVTDEDLHAEGLGLLRQYRVVITGTHPEYYSTAMLDALRGYLDQGGRLMYLGGNGFYWRIAYHPSLPGVIELRRAEDGIRDWVAEPGEYYHSFTGEYGGLWRRLGRPPQTLVGVGMAVQGFDICGHFRRSESSRDPRAAFIFDGVDEEIIGDFGVVGGGAAGLELDRFDLSLGSPRHTLVLASSENLTGLYFPPPEEVNNVMPNLAAPQNPKARGDLVFFETAAGGAVFSVGSISWAGSLSHAGYANSVSRITGNVLRRFCDPRAFEVKGLETLT